jgi:hypothetical protein
VISATAPRLVDRAAPLGWVVDGLGVELEAVEAALLDVPLIVFASAANADEERAEDSSELIDRTMPVKCGHEHAIE